jgi:hypothetical protein
MAALMIIIILFGAVMVVSAVSGAAGAFPYVTTRRKALRLKRLSDRLSAHLVSATKSTQDCYQILRVLIGTTASDGNVMQAVSGDAVWRRAQRTVLANAQRARLVVWKMLRRQPEPAVLLARQCFRSISSTCADCPMLKLNPNKLPERCPSMDAFGEGGGQ